MSSTSATEFTGTAIGLHWIAAVLIIGNLAFGLYMVDLPLSPAKLRYFSWHKWAGMTIFLLSAVRLLWKLGHPAPALPSSMPAWQRKAANASHHVLYLLFFAAPLTGWLFSRLRVQTVYFGVLPIPVLLSRTRSWGHPQGRPPLHELCAGGPCRIARRGGHQAPRGRWRRRARPHAPLPQDPELTHETPRHRSGHRDLRPCPPRLRAIAPEGRRRQEPDPLRLQADERPRRRRLPQVSTRRWPSTRRSPKPPRPEFEVELGSIDLGIPRARPRRSASPGSTSRHSRRRSSSPRR